MPWIMDHFKTVQSLNWLKAADTLYMCVKKIIALRLVKNFFILWFQSSSVPMVILLMIFLFYRDSNSLTQSRSKFSTVMAPLSNSQLALLSLGMACLTVPTCQPQTIGIPYERTPICIKVILP